MLQIVRRFRWTWVGVLVGHNDVNTNLAQSFRSKLARSGLGCVAYMEPVPFVDDPAELQRVVSVVGTSTARVVIVFGYGSYLVKLMEEVCGIIRVNLAFHN